MKTEFEVEVATQTATASRSNTDNAKCSSVVRIFLLLTAIFAAILLLSLNVLFIIYFVLLPPLNSKLEIGNYCAQQVWKKFDVPKDFASPAWFIFGTPIIVVVFVAVQHIDTIGGMYLEEFTATEEENKCVVHSKKPIETPLPKRAANTKATDWLNMTNELTSKINSLHFNTFFAVISVGFNMYLTSRNKQHTTTQVQSVRCFRLVEIFQTVALLVLCARSKFSRRKLPGVPLPKIVEKTEKNLHSVSYRISWRDQKKYQEYYQQQKKLRSNPPDDTVFAYLLFPVFGDAWNITAICTFFFGTILKTAEENRHQWPFVGQLLDGFTIQALLAQTECTCTVAAAPCPLEHFVFAEYAFIIPFIYFWRCYQVWHKLSAHQCFIFLQSCKNYKCKYSRKLSEFSIQIFIFTI